MPLALQNRGLALDDYHMHGRSQILLRPGLPRYPEGLVSEHQTSQYVA